MRKELKCFKTIKVIIAGRRKGNDDEIFLSHLSFAVSWRMWGLPVISLKSKQFRLERPFCRLRLFLAFPFRISASGFFSPSGYLPMGRHRKSRGCPHAVPANWKDRLLPLHGHWHSSRAWHGHFQAVTAFHPVSQAFGENPKQSMLGGQAPGHRLTPFTFRKYSHTASLSPLKEFSL